MHNKQKPALQHYKVQMYDLGDVKQGTKAKFKYDFVGENKPQSVVGQCGCTVAKLNKDGSIDGHIVVNSAIGRDKNTNEVNEGVFLKSIKVFLNDGLPTHIKNEKGNNTSNPNKTFITLYLTGNVTK